MSEKQQDVHAIRRWFNAHVESSLLQTTLQLKLLDPLLNQPHTPLSLAQAYGYDAHGVRVLLQGLAGLGILSPNKEGAFEFVAGQQAAFTPGDSAYIGNAVAEAQQFWFAASEVEQQQMDRLLSLAEAAVIQAPEEVAWLIERAWAFVWTGP